MYEVLLYFYPRKYSISNESEICTLISSLLKSKKKEEDGNDGNDSNQKKDDQLPKEYEEFIKEEIEIVIKNTEMDQLLPALLLIAVKRKFKFNRRLEITHAETESKFKKKVST